MLPANDFVFSDPSHGLGGRVLTYLELVLCFAPKKKSYFLPLFHNELGIKSIIMAAFRMGPPGN